MLNSSRPWPPAAPNWRGRPDMAGFSSNPVSAGQRFGMLVAVEDAGRSNDGHKLWLCRCDCGGSTVKSTNNLRAKRIASCGCHGEKVQKEKPITHGKRYTPTYLSWQAAKARCHNPDSKDYPRYGAKGIAMCAEWRDSFEAFYSDMGDRPPGTSLDRYPDQSGNYEPTNCRWATVIEQARNRANHIEIEWDGQITALVDVAARLGITYGAAYMRLKRGKL